MKLLRDLVIRRSYAEGTKRKMLTSAMMGAAAVFAGSKAKASTVESVLKDQTNSGGHYSISGSGGLNTVGWSFQVNSENLAINELSTLTGESGNNDLITLWNADTNEILAQVWSVADTDQWRTVELDNLIELEQGTNYGITLTSTDGDQYRFVRESFTEDSTSGDISYGDSYYNTVYANYYPGPNGVAPFDRLWDFPNAIGEYQWLVDFGYIDTSAPTDLPNNIAVPTPASLGIGGLMLGILTARRNRKRD
ncbi:DUF4082 domain-containing protein [Planctomycetota bacterium]|nr:DUF4082 domain-containing protein [Planctomycetota bacterium]